MSEAAIDAGAVLDEREREQGPEENPPADGEGVIEGAQGAAKLKGARRPWPAGARTFLIISGLVVAGVVTMFSMKARDVRAESEARKKQVVEPARVARTVPDLKLPPAPPARRDLAMGVPNGPVSVTGGPGSAPQSEVELLQQRRLAKGFGSGEAENGGGPGAMQPQTVPDAISPPSLAAAGLAGASGARPSGGVEEKLEAVELKAASARTLPDRDYLLTQGAMIDCVLETKLISTVAGMSSCHLTRDIYSANGRVVLLDRGSKVVGRYQGGGVQQGDARIFVVWTRVETPSGVVIELQSPGTGPLGEAGLGGWVDTHFWDRFGAAILLSIIQDGADAAAARAAGPGANNAISLSNQATAGKEVVAKSMEPTLNIPPTIYKNQGERVGIFVARDLDFRSVYGLERSARDEP